MKLSRLLVAVMAVGALSACGGLTGPGSVYEFKNPRGGEVWALGSTQTIRWDCNNCGRFDSTIIWVRGDTQNPRVMERIGAGANKGSFVWKVGTFASDPRIVQLRPGIYTIVLINENQGGNDSATFNIVP